MINFLKRPVITFSIILLVVVVTGSYAYFSRTNKPAYDFIVAKKRDLVQEVNVTGRVKPAESIELAFERGGKIAAIYAKVGNEINIGQTLAVLENADITAQLAQAEAALEKDQVKLAELKRGTRPEEIQAAETAVANAEESLKAAEVNLEYVKKQADASLQKEYDSALTALQTSVSTGKNSLLILTDIQYAHFVDNTQEANKLADAKAVAINALLGKQDAGRWTKEFINKLDGGAFGLVEEAVQNPTYENIDKALQETIAALQKIKQTFEIIPITSVITVSEQTNINTEKNKINSEIMTLSSKAQAISVQKAINNSNISLSEANLINAQNALANARENLKIKKAGATKEQIAAQEAQIKTAEANVNYYRAQLAKTVLRAPISGIITKQDTKIGEIVLANTPVVSLISVSQFEIEANVPEADIAKVKVGNTARVTLDAYGRDLVFEAKVTAIDPAETIIDGVATYKTTLQFINNDERIKSGMTANIDIFGDKRENVLAVPQRAIIRKNGYNYVRIVEGKSFKEVKVETGLRGSDGNIEIISGINEGDKVIIFSE